MYRPSNGPPQIKLPSSWIYEQTGDFNLDHVQMNSIRYFLDSYNDDDRLSNHEFTEFPQKIDNISGHNYISKLNLQLNSNERKVEDTNSAFDKRNGSIFSIKKYLQRKLRE